MKAEINEKETNKTIEKSNEINNWFFGKIKITKSQSH